MTPTRQEPSSTARPLAAHELVRRIQAAVGVPWSEITCDTFKAGDPSTPVRRVAVTMMATMDVLRRAVDAGANFILTHEPTFYDHGDEATGLSDCGDAVLAGKRAFLEQHGLVVWRFHDHWHRRSPDGIAEGVVEALGWGSHQEPGQPLRFTLPPTSLAQLAGEVAKRLGARALRVVGDPNLNVTKVALMPGAPSSSGQVRALARDDVDVLVTGETREWETVEYARDAGLQGRRKALILIGHVASEAAGMANCAVWLRTLLPPALPVIALEAGDPFWSPAR